MKILSVTKKDFEEITTDEKYAPLYRRLKPERWEHWMGENHGWIEYRFTDFLEQAYLDYMRHQNAKATTPDK
ncbi:MAG: hypothetical protein WBC50_10275 [Dehalococcoidales bacterium]